MSTPRIAAALASLLVATAPAAYAETAALRWTPIVRQPEPLVKV
jgi:hypothetical protein